MECEKGLLREGALLLAKGVGLSLAGMGYKLLQLAEQDKKFSSLAKHQTFPSGDGLAGTFSWQELAELLHQLVSEGTLHTYTPLTLAPTPLIIYTTNPPLRPH